MVKTMNPNAYNFKIIDNFPGYNSSSDKTKLRAGFLIRGSKNVYKKVSGTIASRPGIKRRGSVDTTQAGVKSAWVWNTSLGAQRHLRVANNKLQIESDIADSGTYVWYDLLETSALTNPASTLTRLVFDSWWDNTEKKDRLIFVRGDDKIFHWSGGIALVSSATATTITKQGIETWAQAGFATNTSGEKKVVINGVEYTYTGGETTTTLTGVTGDASSLTSGMVAIQAVMVSSDEPVDGYACDAIKVINNQAWIGSYTSRIVYVSAATDFLDFENSGSLIPGDPDTVVLDSPFKGIGEKDGQVVIFSGTSDMYVITPNDVLSISFDNEYIQQKIEKKQLPTLNSVLAHEFIGNHGGYLIWLDQRNQLRALGSFQNDVSIKPAHLSLPVQEELKEDDFTGGHLQVIDDIIHITAPNNARDWMYQIREIINENGNVVSERIWHPPQIRGISRFVVLSGETYGHSNVNPMVYQIWNTNQWFDDGPSGEEIPYVCVARFAYMQQEKRSDLSAFDQMWFEGYMLQGVDLRANFYMEYQGNRTGTREIVISNDTQLATFYTGTNPASLGDGQLGVNPLGDGILEESNDQETIPKFRAVRDIPQPKNSFEYSLEIYSLDADARWELLSIGVNSKAGPIIPTDIHRRLGN